jgi:hypothetical protein
MFNKRLTTENGHLRTSVYGDCENEGECRNFDDDDGSCYPYHCDGTKKAIQRLSEYENTRLSPEDIHGAKMKLAVLGAIAAVSVVIRIAVAVWRRRR